MTITREDWRTMAADNRDDSHALISHGFLDTREKWTTLSTMMLAEAVRLGQSRAVMEGMRQGLNVSLKVGRWQPVKKHEWRAMIREASSPGWQKYMALAALDSETRGEG